MTENETLMLRLLAERQGTTRPVYLVSGGSNSWIRQALAELENTGLAVGNDVGVGTTRAYRITETGLAKHHDPKTL